MKKQSNITENNFYGLFKAIFVSGGPGSGKDLIIRESVQNENVVEINATLAKSILKDKHRLAEQTRDFRREAIRNRQPLLINGTTTEYSNICDIKEELEELGYDTMLIFVNTSNESSKKRNEGHERSLDESVRSERWSNAQKVSKKLEERFEKYVLFDNSLDLSNATEDELFEQKDNLEMTKQLFEAFLSNPIINETAELWLYKNNKITANRLFEQLVYRTENTHISQYKKTIKNRLKIEEKNNVSENKTNSKTISTEGSDCSCSGKDGGSQKTGTGYKRLKLLDNICPACQLTAKAGRADSVTDGDIASNTKYTFRTYHEGNEPTFTKSATEKETRFQQDNDKIKAKKLKQKASEAGKVLKPAGVSPEYDTRGSGTVYPMSGLGMVTYREQAENKYGSTAEVTRKSFSKFRKESIDSPSVEMGVTGGYHGPSNKEPLETELDKTLNQTSNKKKKK